MKIKHVDVEFDENGDPTIAPQGYAGRECLEATEAAERALGMANRDRKATADMRKRPNTRTVAR